MQNRSDLTERLVAFAVSNIGLTVGAGPCACPGRYFAMERSDGSLYRLNPAERIDSIPGKGFRLLHKPFLLAGCKARLEVKQKLSPSRGVQ